MRRQDTLDILQRIPEADIVRTCLTLRYGASITLDTLIRFEEDYLIARGREAGTNDDCRAFFVPYEDVLFIKLDRVVVPSEIKRMYGENVNEPGPSPEQGSDSASAMKGLENRPQPGTTTPAPQATDPAGIAKQNLLARIRAARTAATTG